MAALPTTRTPASSPIDHAADHNALAGRYNLQHQIKKRNSGGNITLNSATFAAVDTSLDIVLPASAGDSIEVGLGGIFDVQTVSAVLDVASLVSAAAVSWWATDGTSSAYSLWYRPASLPASTSLAFSGSLIRTLVSGDISGGNVTLRIFGRRDTSNCNILIAAGIPLHFWAKNLGPPSP